MSDMVKVWATSEDAVKALIHPACPTRFVDVNTSVDWPNDQFTFRRIADGDITRTSPDDARAAKPVAAASSHNKTNRSAD